MSEEPITPQQLIDISRQDFSLHRKFPVRPAGGVFDADFTCETGENPETKKWMEEQYKILFEKLMNLPEQ